MRPPVMVSGGDFERGVAYRICGVVVGVGEVEDEVARFACRKGVAMQAGALGGGELAHGCCDL